MIANRLIRIDLTSKVIAEEELSQDIIRMYMGGRGLGIHLLQECSPERVDPLSPENPLIFTTGLFHNSGWPSAVQWQVTSRSPLTGGYGGGFAWGDFGIRLHSRKVAALQVTGSSDRPVMIYISSSGVELIEADDLWLMNSHQTCSALSERFPGSSQAVIGAAGVRKLGLASIIADKYQMIIRTGMGAVMGSKNLKAVIVDSGGFADSTGPVSGDWDGLAYRLNEKVREHPASRRLGELGKPMLIMSKNQVGDLPTRNHQMTSFESADKIDAYAVREITRRNRACHNCPIGCIRETVTETTETEGPEYEPIWALGPRIGNSSLEFLVQLYNRCLEDGVDPIGLGGVLGFAMECSQRGVLEPGMKMEWGSKEDIVAFYGEMFAEEGLGYQLRNGSREYSLRHPESSRYAMQIKGVEISGQEPRQSQAFGLSLAVSNWGGDWGYGLPTMDVASNHEAAKKLFPEMYPEILKVNSVTGKAELIKFTEEFNALSDSLGICKFACPETYALMPEDLLQGYNCFWGTRLTMEEFMLLGERIINRERIFSLSSGIGPEEDTLPERFMQEEITVELFEGDRLSGLKPTGEYIRSVSRIGEMLTEYYDIREWPEGIPSRKKLESLNLF